MKARLPSTEAAVNQEAAGKPVVSRLTVENAWQMSDSSESSCSEQLRIRVAKLEAV